MSVRGLFAESIAGGDLKCALEAVHAHLLAERGDTAANRVVIRLRAAVVTSKRDFLVTPCIYLWLAAALTGVRLPQLLRRAGRDHAWFRRQFMEASAASGVAVTESALTVEIDGAGVFSIRYERLPFLSIFSLFIVEMLGYERLEQAIAPCLKQTSPSTIKAECRRLCADLARKLLSDLPPKQELRRFDAILSFLDARSAGRTVSPRDVSDADVFEFWREWASKDIDIGVRLFESTRESFTRFLLLWSVAETAADERRAMTLDEHPELAFGPQREDADHSAVASALALFETDDADGILGSFLETIERSPLKLVVATKLRKLRMFMAYPSAAEGLHRSRARGDAFDGAQRRVAAAAAKALSRSEILMHVEACASTDYDAVVDELSVTLKNVESALWGSVHILKENRLPEAVDFAMMLADSTMMQDIAQCIDCDTTSDMDELVAELRKIVLEGRRHAALDVLFQRAEAAFVKTKREGFEPERMREPVVVGAAQALGAVYRDHLGWFWRRHAQLAACLRAPDRPSAFDEDLRLFRQAFAEIYAPQE